MIIAYIGYVYLAFIFGVIVGDMNAKKGGEQSESVRQTPSD